MAFCFVFESLSSRFFVQRHNLRHPVWFSIKPNASSKVASLVDKEVPLVPNVFTFFLPSSPSALTPGWYEAGGNLSYVKPYIEIGIPRREEEVT